MKQKIKIGALNIYGKQYTVHSDVSLHPKFAGLCVYADQELLINPMQDSMQKRISFFHEMIHSIVERTALSQGGLTSEVEEILCDTAATILAENWDEIKSIVDRKLK